MSETYYDKLQPYVKQGNLQCRYKDSVTEDNPRISKVKEINKILKNDEIDGKEGWYVDNNIVISWGYKDIADADCNEVQIWTSVGWKNFKKLIRHETEKKLPNKIKTSNCWRNKRSQFDG